MAFEEFKKWTLGPDCAGGECDSLQVEDVIQFPSLLPALVLEETFGMAQDYCHLCTNWDHFSSHGFAGLEDNASRSSELEQEMVSAMRAGDKIAAFKAAQEAAHYRLDAQQCGHTSGNFRCDPRASSPQPECELFVAGSLGRLWLDADLTTHLAERAARLNNFLFAVGTFGACRACGNSPSVAYAAAERYIRHHSYDLQLDDRPNFCEASCSNGECELATGLNNRVQLETIESACRLCEDSPSQVCGDLRLEAPEQCERGVGVPCPPGRTCDFARCECVASPPPFPGARCGNGIVELDEVCEQGTCPEGFACTDCKACTRVDSGPCFPRPTDECNNQVCECGESVTCPQDCHSGGGGGTGGICDCDADGDGLVTALECEICCGGTLDIDLEGREVCRLQGGN